jgi:hypothetical protein
VTDLDDRSSQMPVTLTEVSARSTCTTSRSGGRPEHGPSAGRVPYRADGVDELERLAEEA